MNIPRHYYTSEIKEKQFQRIPPQNIEAERCVISAILLKSDSLNQVIDILTPDDFYVDSHKIIYSHILKLYEKGEPIDIITLTNILRERNYLEKIGGAVYLSSISIDMPTAANIEHYAKIIKEKSLLRELINVGTSIVEMGYNEEEPVEDLIDKAEKIVFEVGQSRTSKGFVPVGNIVFENMKKIEKLYEQKQTITGVASGFTDLDNLTNGFQPSDLIIIAGRPSMGKTTLCLSIAQNVAINYHIPVGLFSLEMSKEQLVMRMLCSEACLDLRKLRSGNLDENEWKKLTKSAAILNDAPIYIDDTASFSVMQLKAKARRISAEYGLGLIIIDYLQLMRDSGRVKENREKEISEISRSLKILAKEMNIPIIALSQLNRSVEQRADKHPQLSDLRESGSIEQDADVVIFIYRDEVYNKPPKEKDCAEIIVAKQRNGPTGLIKLAFPPPYTMFKNYTVEQRVPPEVLAKQINSDQFS